MATRNIFGKLMEGAAATRSHREAERTLRSKSISVLQAVVGIESRRADI